MTIYDELYELGKKRAKHTVWVISDLQQRIFEHAKQCLETCMADYELLESPAEYIWYLGDAVQGEDKETLERLVDLQEKTFGSLNIPLLYAMGNHDMDYSRRMIEAGGKEEIWVPFHDMVSKHEGWYTTASVEDTYFSTDFHDFKLFVFGDHISKEKKWVSTHNKVVYGREYYPYEDNHFKEISQEIKNCGKPVITLSHYAFPGGNRESDLNAKLQPLPLNVRLHLYGHSHIGEYAWPKERVFSQISWVDWQDIPQIDVASFENYRGNYCHSVILQIYEDNTLGVFFRNHDAHCFTSAFFPAKESEEKEGAYEEMVKKYSDK